MFNITPVVSPHSTDCGATCLKMLLSYYDIEVDLATLVEECNTTIVGCSAKDINATGRKYGLDMKPYKMDAAEVVRQDRPSIVWWKHNHFVICCGCDFEGKVVIINPDLGQYRMTLGTFESFYSEIALFNGEPVDIVESTDASSADYVEALQMLGVEV